MTYIELKLDDIMRKYVKLFPSATINIARLARAGIYKLCITNFASPAVNTTRKNSHLGHFTIIA